VVRLTVLGALGTVALGSLIWLPQMLGQQKKPANVTMAADITPPALKTTQEEADRFSVGCISCHGPTDSPSMHTTNTVRIGCTQCHGGKAEVMKPNDDLTSKAYKDATKQAHVMPKQPELAKSSANAERVFAKWFKENKEFVKFVNPGDLRVAEETCGRCHSREVRYVQTSMMTHGGMLWAAALYNNAGFPLKDANFGESYGPDGMPRKIMTWPPPTEEETRLKGVLPGLEPLGRWEISQPGNVLRVFERGARARGDLGSPIPDEDPGRPDDKLSDRGFGTSLRTDPVFLGLQKTRLLDPILSMPGTNDHPGDYRQSGCTACHVIYANDRDPVHSGPYAKHGNQGFSSQIDPTIPKNESGHPIKHQFTRSIPTSTCIVCHIHPGTNMVASYLGYTWWDSEMDAEKGGMYPEHERFPSDDDRFKSWEKNPQGAAARGKWGDSKFLQSIWTDVNPKLEHTQFADFHGHGWVFRAVYKRDRDGNLLDKDDKFIDPKFKDKFNNPTNEEAGKAVHLKDIHLQKGMHCADCHFAQDSHGNGKIYGETRNAVEIDCIDCHGTIRSRATLQTSAAAAPKGGNNLMLLRTPFGQRRFYWEDGKLFQRSSTEENKQWEVVQVVDAITPGNPHYNEKARRAKTMLKDNSTWGSIPGDDASLAHSNSKMTCYTCHSSWTTSCFGCHLPMIANKKQPMLHNEGLETRNYTSYNFEVLRDDVYMLGIDGTVTGHRIAPTRSTCAVVVSSQNANRDWIYYQQQTISAEGYSGFGFSPYFPHTVRAKETKTCTDCHYSEKKDNNAWMAQIVMQGTNLVNMMGRYVYVATGSKGFDAVVVAEHDDPTAVFGSDLHKLVYPHHWNKIQKHHKELEEVDHHAGNVLDVQLRGEYLYAAIGKGGFRVYDVANIDNKNFSEKMNTAPVSPLGQKFFVKTKNAVAIASPTTLGVDPLRSHDPRNEECPPGQTFCIPLFYGFLYVADLEEGLVIVGDRNLTGQSPGVGTLLDGNPANNFLKRFEGFNPDGVLTGARRITIVGHYAYILANSGLVVVDIGDPFQLKVTAQIKAPDLVEPQGVQVQFRYGFVVDKQGLKTLDVTDLAHPKLVPGALVPLEDARNLYIARTFAYVAGGKQGLVIVDVTKAEEPKLAQVFNEHGEISDTRDVKIGMTASSAFAYLADGKHGLRIVELFGPNSTPNFLGFSPKPVPKLIATFKTKGPALMVSKGVDRDRAVDESGNQLTVFNRRGSRPFNQEEAARLYRHKDGTLYWVSDTPNTPPRR
jgi:hypothetical protein